MGTTAGVAAIQAVLDRYEAATNVPANQAVYDDAELVTTGYTLSALLGRFGLSGIASLYDAGFVSAGQFFYCVILTWSSSEIPVSQSTAIDLEMLALWDNPAASGTALLGQQTAIASLSELSNDPMALRSAMAYVVNFVRANNISGVLPSVT